MQTMFDVDITSRVAKEHYRQLLRQAEEERQARVSGNGEARRRLRPLPSLGLVKLPKPLRTAEHQGRHLGQLIYNCYIELLDRGLPRQEALELTKSLIGQLDRQCRGGGREAELS